MQRSNQSTILTTPDCGDNASSDRELIQRSQRGDHRAFKVLMQRYERAVNAWIFQIVPHWYDRSDLVQDVFIRVWRSIGTLRRSEAFTLWLRRLATHIAYDHMRRLPRVVISSIESPDRYDNDTCTIKEIVDDSGMPDVVFERAELDCAIRKALAKLPDEFRIAIVLREMGGLSYEEISERTDTGLGTVKSRISRGSHESTTHFEVLSPLSF